MAADCFQVSACNWMPFKTGLCFDHLIWHCRHHHRTGRVKGHEQLKHETCDGQIQLTVGRRIRWLLKNVTVINSEWT